MKEAENEAFIVTQSKEQALLSETEFICAFHFPPSFPLVEKFWEVHAKFNVIPNMEKEQAYWEWVVLGRSRRGEWERELTLFG